MDKKKLIEALESNSLDQLRSFIQNDPGCGILKNKCIKFGDSLSLIDFNNLAKWFLYRSHKVSPIEAVNNLEKFNLCQELPGQDILALYGTKIKQDIHFENNISLIKYENLPDSVAKSYFDPESISQEFKADMQRESMSFVFNHVSNDSKIKPTAALICKNTSAPVLISDEPPVTQQTYNPKFSTLIEICNCLTLIGPSSPRPLAEWWEADDWVPYSRLFGFSSSIPTFDLLNSGSYSFIDSDHAKAKLLIQNYLKLSDNDKSKLHIPLQRLNRAVLRHSSTDIVVELGICIEALFLTDNEQNELSYRIKHRAGWLLGKNTDDRNHIAQLFERIYKYRSKAVHRGKLPETEKIKIDINDGIKKTAEAIGKIIENGWPNWEILVLGKADT